MARVKLHEACILDGVRYEVGEVVEVSDEVADLNPWMHPTKEPLTRKAKQKKDEKGED